MKVFMRRSGQLELILLPLVALVLVLIVMFSLASFNSDFEGKTEEATNVFVASEFAQQYVIQSAIWFGEDALENGGDIKEEFRNLASSRDVGTKYYYEGSGNFFGKIRNGDFSFEREGGEWILEIKDLFVDLKYKDNNVRKDFDLEIKFSGNGEFEDYDVKFSGKKLNIKSS